MSNRALKKIFRGSVSPVNEQEEYDQAEDKVKIFDDSSDISTDLDKDSFHSLHEIDKEKLSKLYPNQIISNKKFNKIFNVPLGIRQRNKNEASSSETKIDFDLIDIESVEECDIRKAQFDAKRDKKQRDKFFREDLKRRLKIRQRFFELQPFIDPNQNVTNEDDDCEEEGTPAKEETLINKGYGKANSSPMLSYLVKKN